MTDQEANAINLDTEKNPDTLQELVKFWRDKAHSAITELNSLKEPINSEVIKSKLNVDLIKEIIKKTE